MAAFNDQLVMLDTASPNVEVFNTSNVFETGKSFKGIVYPEVNTGRLKYVVVAQMNFGTKVLVNEPVKVSNWKGVQH